MPLCCQFVYFQQVLFRDIHKRIDMAQGINEVFVV
ncbi:MAG: hypothetical protein BMS9Abin08_0722 [Gammaproteobacteria bacterium]|nr:MAG: hypothetical protein BMS9Abin08_0722 [Gammaproteobacteria bacterium]